MAKIEFKNHTGVRNNISANLKLFQKNFFFFFFFFCGLHALSIHPTFTAKFVEPIFLKKKKISSHIFFQDFFWLKVLPRVQNDNSK